MTAGTARVLIRRAVVTILTATIATFGPVGAIAWAKSTTTSSPPGPVAASPGSYTVEAIADPVLLEASLPTVLPLDVALGLAHSGVKIDNQPLVVVDTAPLYLPLIGALGILGGTAGLNDLVAKLLPNIIVGLPTIVGRPGFNLDPAQIPLPKIPDLSKVPFDKTACVAYFPGTPHEVSCGGIVRNLAGTTVRQAAGQATSTGDVDDRASLQAQATTKVMGITNSILPISVGSLSSSVSSKVVNGQITATTSIELTDVDVLGMLQFSRVTAGSTAALGGVPGSSSFRQDQCSITRARVAGHAVSIEADGVRVTESGAGDVDVRSAQMEVDKLLGTLGVNVRSGKMSSPEVSPDGTSLSSTIDCVEISWSAPVSGSRARVVVGQNVLKLSASPPEAPIDLPPEDDSRPRWVAFVGPDLRRAYPFFVLLVIGVPLLAQARRASLRTRYGLRR